MNTTRRRIEGAWRRLSALPGGRRIFDLILGRLVPYSGSVRPRVLELEPGHAVVVIRERRRLRNHLGSIHAIALANVGELASGLAMTMALPGGIRGIPIRLEIEYLKKARGRIVAEGRAAPPASVLEPVEDTVTAELRDDAGEVVSRVRVLWRLAPEEP
jgi:acyl-coenzyme A thioesterase PaaI-like protein